MLSNFLVTFWRQLKTRPAFYILNISGLSIALAIFLLIFQYSRFEFSYDQYHTRSKDLYRVNLVYTPASSNDPYIGAAVFAGVGPSMEQDFPEVELSTRICTEYGGAILKQGENYFKQEDILYAEPSLFEMFHVNLVQGNPETALSEAYSTVLSESVAEKLFGKENPIGKMVEVRSSSGSRDFLVTGVHQNEANSHIKGAMYLSWTSQDLLRDHDLDANWRWFDWVTYVRTVPGANVQNIEDGFPEFIDKYRGERRGSNILDFDLVSVPDIHLHSNINQELGENGDYQSVFILLLIAVLIVIIAWVNYVNLYTAKMVQRGKEVGIRKTLGSSKAQLRSQFLIESLLVNFIALMLAVFLYSLASTQLSIFLGHDTATAFRMSQTFWLSVILLWILSSAFSGLYPALVISRFPVLQALKSITNKHSAKVRRLIVVWQFMASAGLMTFAFIVYGQLTAMNEQTLGVETNDIIALEVPNFTGNASAYSQAIETLKSEVMGISGIESVAYSSDVPGEQIGWRGSAYLLGQNGGQEETGLVFRATVDKGFTGLYNLNLIAGRDFLQDSDSSYVIINNSTVSLLGFEEPQDILNRQVVFPGIDTLRVLGVVADFYQESLKEPIKPTAFLMISSEIDLLSIKVNNGGYADVIDEVELSFNEIFPAVPFQWRLIEDRLADRHQSEATFLDSLKIFVVVSVLISILGLVGLVSYMSQKRLKEIGIRKVLGSSVSELFYIMYSDFVKLIILGNLIALPIGYYFSNLWLDGFAFRIAYIWWLPMVIVLMSLFIAFACSVFQISKSVRVNPVHILRSE